VRYPIQRVGNTFAGKKKKKGNDDQNVKRASNGVKTKGTLLTRGINSLRQSGPIGRKKKNRECLKERRRGGTSGKRGRNKAKAAV